MIVDIISTPAAKKFLSCNWPPIFQKSEVEFSDLSEWMQNLVEKEDFPKEMIVQRMHAKNILLHTSLLKFYLKNGFYITRIHKFYEYEGRECFKKVYSNVYEALVHATETKDEMKATAVKLVSNSMYGQLLLVSLILNLLRN